jgi:hypothetical protein
MQNPDRKRFMALGTDAIPLSCLLRIKADPALTVTVQVILAFFGIELDRSGQAVSGAQGFGDREVVHGGGESSGLPAQHGRGMSV